MPDAVQPILYTQAGCRESGSVRDWLVDRGIAFIERNVSSDPDAAVALAATGTFATPLLVVGEEEVLGYRPQTLAALLGHRDEVSSTAVSTRRR